MPQVHQQQDQHWDARSLQVVCSVEQSSQQVQPYGPPPAGRLNGTSGAGCGPSVSPGADCRTNGSGGGTRGPALLNGISGCGPISAPGGVTFGAAGAVAFTIADSIPVGALLTAGAVTSPIAALVVGDTSSATASGEPGMPRPPRMPRYVASPAPPAPVNPASIVAPRPPSSYAPAVRFVPPPVSGPVIGGSSAPATLPRLAVVDYQQVQAVHYSMDHCHHCDHP